MKDSIVKTKSYAFAVNVVRLARELRQRHEFELSKQVLRSGTSIGANIEEALAGISRRDFTAKMSIASKEARETHYWLRLIQDSESLTSNVVPPMLRDVEELLRILTAIVKTSQNGTSRETKHSTLKTKNFKDVYA
ncbi:MAG TPA: four helix bundle protein [Nitrospiraceae bacterium]|nr:four helix bundle protein [Nitrospiraceae bacterium]